PPAAPWTAVPQRFLFSPSFSSLAPADNSEISDPFSQDMPSSSSSFLSLASDEDAERAQLAQQMQQMLPERLYNYKSLSSLPLATTAAYIIGSGCHFVHTQAGPSIDAVVYGSRFTTRSQPVLGYSRMPHSAPPADDGRAEVPNHPPIVGVPDTADSEPVMRIRLQQRPPVSAGAFFAASRPSPPPHKERSSGHAIEDTAPPAPPSLTEAAENPDEGIDRHPRRRKLLNSHLPPPPPQPPSLLLLSGLHSNRGFRNRQSETAAGLLSKRPEYLRIFDQNNNRLWTSQQPAMLSPPWITDLSECQESPPPSSAASSAVATNHLLLSGVNTEFDPELVFRHSSSLASSSPASARAIVQSAAPLMFQPAIAANPEPLPAASEPATPLPPASNAGATESDTLSFRTALSDLSESESQLPSSPAIDIWRPSSRASHDDDDDDDDGPTTPLPGAAACLHGSLAQMMAKTKIAPPPAVAVSSFRPSPLLLSSADQHQRSFDSMPRSNVTGSTDDSGEVISPLSHKSVPVAVQARKARHPVYRLGALANETFESGRHQEAFDLYSWAIQLLNPAEGTTAREMLDARAAAMACEGRRATRGTVGRSSRSNSQNGSREEAVAEQKNSNGRSWLSFGRRSGKRAAIPTTVVIDEPLPSATLSQTPAGQYEFSEAMLRQLPSYDFDDPDPWFMPGGEEKTDVTALLYSNRSAAAFALGKYATAVSDATKSIELRPEWAKGYFRRGEALLALGRIRDS
ncbi:Stress-induced-phosphoprotein 1, partial [Coemansia sp. S85]